MRTSILPIFLLLLTVLSACSREIPFPETEGELIVLNALLSTDETEHTLFLSLSSPQEGNRPLSGAQVRCTVGDGPAIPAEEGITRDNATQYHFEASIRPGDRVRIEAGGEGLRAVAQAIAPPAPLPAAVDTLSRDGRMYFTLHVRERQDQPDYWQLRLSYRWREQIDYYWRERNPYPENPDFDFTPGMYIDTHMNVSGQELPLDPGEDPVLNDGYTPQSVIDRYYNTNAGFLFEFSPVNKTRIFSDHLFSGSEADVRFSTDAEPLRWIDGGSGGGNEWQRLHYRCTRTLTLRLLALNEESWAYLGAVNRQKNRNGFNYLLVEPVTFPSNVEGGLGFLSVASAAPIEIAFPEIDRPDW